MLWLHIVVKLRLWISLTSKGTHPENSFLTLFSFIVKIRAMITSRLRNSVIIHRTEFSNRVGAECLQVGPWISISRQMNWIRYNSTVSTSSSIHRNIVTAHQKAKRRDLCRSLDWRKSTVITLDRPISCRICDRFWGTKPKMKHHWNESCG